MASSISFSCEPLVHQRTPAEEAKAILSETLHCKGSGPWVPVDAISHRLAASGQVFSDSADLLREDRARCRRRSSTPCRAVVVRAGDPCGGGSLLVHRPGRTARPRFLPLGIDNILWKKVRRAEITRADADQILAQLPGLPVQRHPARPCYQAAFDLAHRSERTVYDCLYLALAVQLGGRMVTADQRLHNGLGEHLGFPMSAGSETRRRDREWRSERGAMGMSVSRQVSGKAPAAGGRPAHPEPAASGLAPLL